MCGLVALVSRKHWGFNSRELDLFETMLMFDTVRGKDSTGVMSAFKNKDVQVVKTATQPFLLYETEHWDKFRQKVVMDGRFVAGHNRAATKGTIKNENAHPFVEKNIILMHNGTLFNHDNLTKEKVEVDSHAIAHALSVEAPDVVIPKIRGAFALIWYNTETERLYAIRNDDRPLFLIEVDDFYMLASEPWIASIPAQRQGRKILDTNSIEPYDLLSWDSAGKMELSKVKKPLSGPTSGYGEWLGEQGRRGNWNGQRNSRWDGDDVGAERLLPPTKVETADGTGEVSDVPFTIGESDPNVKQSLDPVALRSALTTMHRNKAARSETRSESCALTQRGGQDSTSPKTESQSTTTTPACSPSKKTEQGTSGIKGEEERLEAQQRSIIVHREDFLKGTEVLVKIWQMNRQPSGRVKWTGKIMSPNREMFDAQGFLPDNVLPSEWPLWMKETICKGNVGWVTKTIGGFTIWVVNTERCKYTDIHGSDIPVELWREVVHNHCCVNCGDGIEHFQKNYTHVKLKHEVDKAGCSTLFNSLIVLCPDCVGQKMPDGAIYDKFIEKYNRTRSAVLEARKKPSVSTLTAAAESIKAAADCDCAVPDRKPVGAEPVGKNGSTVVVPGPETLQ